MPRARQAAFTRAIQLRYAKAEDVAATIAKGLGKDVNVTVEKDARTNKLVLRATENSHRDKYWVGLKLTRETDVAAASADDRRLCLPTRA